MARFGFCGPTYSSQSLIADAQRCVNFYPEVIESQLGKSMVALYPTPGLKVFCTLAGPSVRGQAAINGRCFAVSGGVLSEVFGNGTSAAVGNLANDGLPVSMTASPTQLLVASAGHGYVYDLGSGVFTADPANLVNPAMVAYFDSYFVSIQGGTNKFQISTPLDATNWSGLNVIPIQVFPDNLVAMVVDHREMWVFGQTKSTVYYDSGSSSIFDVNPNAGVIEQGLEAAVSVCRCDNTIYWLGNDERGAAVAYRANGYTPQRISNHAIECAWSQYPTRKDAIGYSYQEQGHTFWVLQFPSGKATWVFDAATQMWHERAYLNNGALEAHLGQNHVYAFGKHLVGDRQSGNIYQISLSFYDDAGKAIRRMRRAPHISVEQQWIFHNQLQVDVEAGLGLQSGQGSDPKLMLRWSDDGGKTWSNEYMAGAGKAGQYKARAIWRRLGRGRDRVYEISASDPIPWRIVDAYLMASPGYDPQPRAAAEYAKRS